MRTGKCICDDLPSDVEQSRSSDFVLCFDAAVGGTSDRKAFLLTRAL